MIIVVLDTNTLASGAVAMHGTVAAMIDAWLNDEYSVVLSPEILDELTRTLTKPYFTRRLTQQDTRDYLTLVQAKATIVRMTASVINVATHPEDDLILATAISSNADYLVTGDAQLQKLRDYQGVHILSPVTFLAMLTEEQGDVAA